MTVRVRTPRHEVRMTSAASDHTPSKRAVLRALPGSRHFHVCGSLLVERQSLETASSALARARSVGASTSLDVSALPPRRDWRALRSLLSHVDVLFADSESLRALAERARIGIAATSMLELGVSAIAVRLGAGGSRVYSRDKTNRAIRVPSFGVEVERAGSAFASGYLLGSLLGSRPEVCGVLGSAAALETTKPKLPDRRELASRLAEARRNPLFRKLVPALSEGGRLLDQTRRLPRRDLAPSKPSTESLAADSEKQTQRRQDAKARRPRVELSKAKPNALQLCDFALFSSRVISILFPAGLRVAR